MVNVFPCGFIVVWLLKLFLTPAVVIGTISCLGGPSNGWISGLSSSFNFFLKWFATVVRMSLGFVINFHVPLSIVGFAKGHVFKGLTALNITSSLLALLIA